MNKLEQSSELDKIFNPAIIEQKWYKKWEEQNCFAPVARTTQTTQKSKKSKTFSMIMPPPNVTGKLHMGHALNNTCQDILVRYKRMMGYETLWIPGTDHAGIATQSVVEKKIFQEKKMNRHQIGREAFLKEIWNWKNQYGEEIIMQLKALGVSCDWSYFTFTMDPIPNQAVKKVFTKLFNDGLIYQAEKIINWDTVLQSAISDAEVEYEEVQGNFYSITYKIKNSDESLMVSTTRPETLFGDTAVAVNPNDERYRHLIGQMCIVPLCHREIPIIADTHVDVTTGTGCLKVTPGHDFNDFEIGQRHLLPIISILTPNGTFNELAPHLEGLDVANGRKKTIELLQEQNLLVSIKPHTHQVGHGQRSGSIIEPRISKQWFLNVKELAAQAVHAVKSNKTNFIPQNWENTYFSWLDKPQDWCLSRQLWWGHRIPVYTCNHCQHVWASENDPHNCPQCKNSSFLQDPDVLDTWFSSALWPLSTLGWPNEKAMQAKRFSTFYPTTTLSTAYDIIFFWVARMMMLATPFAHNQVPFQHVYIHAMVRDKFGRKMSKSLGNGIDPMEMIKLYGCDAVRFTLASGAGFGRSINLDPARIESFRNFTNKIWNAYRFVAPFFNAESSNNKNSKLVISSLDLHEKWILAELNLVIKKVNDALENYRFDEACSALYHFIYEQFCSWFIELSKTILYQGSLKDKNQRALVLKTCFKELLSLIHPFMPFLSEELWSKFNDSLLISAPFPQPHSQWSFPYEQEKMNELINVVTIVRNLKTTIQLSPKEKISLEIFTNDASTAKFLFDQQLQLKKLLNVYHGKIFTLKAPRPKKSIMMTTGKVEVFIHLEGLIDIKAEKDRLQKQYDKIKIDWDKTNAMLNNKNFIARAPENVVQETREKLMSYQEQLASIEKRMGML